mgnify:CR=1 FL=1
MQISEKKLVILQYKLYVKDEFGKKELFEETTPERPCQYIQGIGMFLPKFEEYMEGLSEGDTFNFMIEKQDGFGEYDEKNIIDLPKNIFFIDGKFDEEHIVKGEIVPMMDSEGNRIAVEIVEVKDDAVTVDMNAPLAGEDLYFEGRVIAVSELTDEEIHSMMHHSCGGGCSCDSCGGSCGEEGGSCGCNGGCC